MNERRMKVQLRQLQNSFPGFMWNIFASCTMSFCHIFFTNSFAEEQESGIASQPLETALASAGTGIVPPGCRNSFTSYRTASTQLHKTYIKAAGTA
jgi:hypothetical protein